MASVPLATMHGTRTDEVESTTKTNSSVDEPPDDLRNDASCGVKLAPVSPLVEDLLPAGSSAGLLKKGSFMITRVVAKSDGDSVDDLDDVTNTEEISSVAEVSHNRWSSAETVHSPCEFSPRLPGLANIPQVNVTNNQLCHIPVEDVSVEAHDVQSRFRIVKLESRTPFLRGRWTCLDFIDPPSSAQANGSSNSRDVGSDVDNPVPPPIYFVNNFPGVAFTPAFVYCSDGLPVLERNPLKSLADGNYNTVVSVDQSSMLQSSLPKNNVVVEDDKSNVMSGVPAVTMRRQSDLSILSNPANILVLPDASNNFDSASGTFAIDNKIEQAMDLVKSHLMFAVHEEVEVLKEQIKELTYKNAQLEHENDILRGAASPEILARLDTTPALSTTPKLLGQPSTGPLS